MRIIAVLLSILFAIAQFLIAWYWSQAVAVEQFESVFASIYGGVPAWSAMAFSIGPGWFVAPLLIGVFLIAAFFNNNLRTYLGRVSLAAFLITGLMVYAMYPVHLMLSVPV
nr:hypothetical protein [uncultured Pseudomonas sp.]